jgi:hypothetical protein
MSEVLLTFLQRQELEAARKAGLSEEQLAVCTGNHLNYLQIREVTAAVKNGVPFTEVQRAAEAHIANADMQELFRCILNHEETLVEIPEPKHRFHIPVRWIIPLCAAVLAGLIILIVWPDTPEQVPFSLLKEEVTLAVGDLFQPEQYIAANDYAGALKLPSSFHAVRPEDRIAVYETEDNGKQYMLRIHVVDETPPVLQLRQQEVYLSSGTKFQPMDYVESLSDNYDSLSISQIEVNDPDPGAFVSRSVEYIVNDSSGNQTVEVLHVIYEADERLTEQPAEASPQAEQTAPAAVAPSEPYVPYVPQIQQPPEETVIETVIESTAEEVSSGETRIEHHLE